MGRLRISAISYLNTAPLMWDFRKDHSAFDISYTVPSQCAAQMAKGSADIGIIPAIAYANIPGLAIVPGVAIASKSAVRSILLVSKVPLEEIKTVALDSSSLTSVGLIQILFAKWWKGDVLFTSADPHLSVMLSKNDAALVIGDTALQVDRSRYFTIDLAEEWVKFTGKPFVFAFWAIRQTALDDVSPALDIAAIFQQSRNHGTSPDSVDAIAREWAPRLDLPEENLKSYLTHNVHYYLDSDCLDGLTRFYKFAAECGLLPDIPRLRFLEAHKLALI